jgi:hypothetical protein
MSKDTCPVCEEFSVNVPIHGPVQLQGIVDRLKEALDERRLLVDAEQAGQKFAGQPPFRKLALRRTLPDVMEYRFRCTACARLFSLRCESYHGSGGRWSALGN